MEELQNFKYFKEHQLANIDFKTGQIDVYAKTSGKYVYVRKNVGSINADGYQRIWCHKRLRMKHRLIYWLYHNKMPIEIDHIDGNRNNNSISNLRSVDRKEQLTNINYPTQGKTRFKFTDKHLNKICEMFEQGFNNTQISTVLGCSRTAIKDIRNKRRHGEFVEKYFNNKKFND